MITKLFSRSKKADQKDIIVVSGLPRSGTSMMMKMLEAGGLTCLTDEIRKADEDNPKGYYEFERVKKLKEGDYEWLPEARGKVVKIISALLTELPSEYQYKLIFMQREMHEILASQREMLVRRGEDPNKVSDEEIAGLLDKHLQNVFRWVESQPNVQMVKIKYNAMLKDPEPYVKQINQFLGNSLDVEKMKGIVDPKLYRQRQENT